MTSSPNLTQAYLKTEYRVQTAGGVNVLKIDQKSDFLERAHKMHLTDRSAFITACNPASKPMDDAANEAAMQQMNEEVSERWPKYLGEGADPTGAWPPEASYLVMGIDYRDAIELAHKYNQNAFLYAYKEPVPRLYVRDSGAVPNKFPFGYKPYFSPDRKVENLHVNFVPKQPLPGHQLSEKAQGLIAYIKDHNYACPLPMPWNKFWQSLPRLEQDGEKVNPPNPLILGAWHHADEKDKFERLCEHIIWADKNNYIDQADTHLRRLNDQDWLTWPEQTRGRQ